MRGGGGSGAQGDSVFRGWGGVFGTAAVGGLGVALPLGVAEPDSGGVCGEHSSGCGWRWRDVRRHDVMLDVGSCGRILS